MSLPRLFVALDLDTPINAIRLARRFEGMNCGLKVGPKLFTAGGFLLVEGLRDMGFPIFLDLKFHDIPEVVAGAVQEATQLRMSMLTVHASGGVRMLRAAQEAAQAQAKAQGIPAPVILAVTVLTSLSAQELETIGWGSDPGEAVERLARLAVEAGLEGIVCSPLELERLRSLNLPLKKLTPGIRPAGLVNAQDGQVRIATPEHALAAGADWLVIGRPVIHAPDPVETLRSLLQKLDA